MLLGAGGITEPLCEVGAGASAAAAEPEEGSQADGAAAASASAKRAEGLQTGRWVRIIGLRSKPDANGLEGKLAAFHQDSDRWAVAFSKEPTLMVRPCNLEAVQGRSRARMGRDFMDMALARGFLDAHRSGHAFDTIYARAACCSEGVRPLLDAALGNGELFDDLYSTHGA